MKTLPREPRVPNKYNLTVTTIRKLTVHRELLPQPPFWRNDVIHAWCICGSTALTEADEEYCCTDEYWLGVYDEDAPAYAGKIRVTFSSYGGMCSYNFKQFYKPSDIENDLDLRIQENFLEVMNRLIDIGVFTLPEKGET